ncbi:MAG TPA: RsmG family class I SAM-dependent methyltransferase [Thermoanaerobaculia bacterium]|nr:RsmG family class I SAM-dependent methyltransferase [Thermoanaerobaculia bacterium]
MLPEGGEAPVEVFRRRLEDRAPAYPLPLGPQALDQLAAYLAFLDRERRRTNLTGPMPPDELVEHALESALGAGLLPPEARIADVGSGAGFPGIPLAIASPSLRLVPVEPRRKRRDFLAQAAAALSLSNLEPSVSSVRSLRPASLDAAVSRAVGGIAAIMANARFLRPGGSFLAWTTDRHGLEEELGKLFRLERVLRVPDTAHKTVALYRFAEAARPAG